MKLTIHGAVSQGLVALMMAFFTLSAASVSAGVDQSVVDAITKNLEAGRNDLKINSIEASQIPGIYKVNLSGTVLYSNEQGSYFITGDLFQVTNRGFVNLGELDRNKDRIDLMAKVDLKDMVIFPAKGERRASISVFTDVDCHYCQKLHQEVPKMNEMGIEVRYLAYPRAGIGSKSYEKIATAWCADDRLATLTKLKNREDVAIKVCDDNPVADQLRLGQAVGVRGTPAIVMEDGRLLPGYLPADKMAETIGLR